MADRKLDLAFSIQFFEGELDVDVRKAIAILGANRTGFAKIAIRRYAQLVLANEKRITKLLSMLGTKLGELKQETDIPMECLL